ncbi:hypothetical protein GGS20DRAFT_112604 [Poronia punctata]|nr:hypothetical protein GGS20DRAFT_112604 [Poronia punctata]
MKSARLEGLMKKICGDISPDEKIYDEERRAVLALHRRFQNETLNNALKFVRQMIQGDDMVPGVWAELADLRINHDPEVLQEKIGSAWSWDRFYIIWHWFRDFVDGENSKPLAKYYCEQMWQWVVLETIQYIRIEKKNPREKAGAQKMRIERYVALPGHENFVKVRRDHFVEKSPALKGSRGAKKQKVDVAAARAHVKMTAPPPADDDEEGQEGGEGREGGEGGEGGGEGQTGAEASGGTQAGAEASGAAASGGA